MNILSYTLCITFLVFSFQWNVQADSLGAVAEKRALLEKLDSIDMKKQIRKRKGQSLEDLEIQSGHVKDSIAALKQNLSRRNAFPELFHDNGDAKDAQRQPRDQGEFLPKSNFDWIVFIVTAIAIIAGIILCIGFIVIIVRIAAHTPQRAVKKPQHDAVAPGAALPPDYTAKAAELHTVAAEKKIDSLRKKINEESATGVDSSATVFTPDSAPVAMKAGTTKDRRDDDTAVTNQSVSDNVNKRATDIKQRIINAASDGLTIMDISKKFHLSIDQVSLILRVANQEDDKK